MKVTPNIEKVEKVTVVQVDEVVGVTVTMTVDEAKALRTLTGHIGGGAYGYPLTLAAAAQGDAERIRKATDALYYALYSDAAKLNG